MNPTPHSKSISLVKILGLACAGLEILIGIGLIALAIAVSIAESSIRSGSRMMILGASSRSSDFSYVIRLARHKSVSLTNLPTPPAAAGETDIGSVSLGPFSLGAGKAGQPAASGVSTDKDVQIRNAEGTVVFTEPEKAIDALRAVKWPAVIGEVCAMLSGLVFFEMLRRLLRSAAKGDLFTDTNVGSLRTFGLLMIIMGIVRFAVGVLLVSRMNAFVAPYVAEGTSVALNSFTGRLSDVISGVTLLVLAEVFREGLKFRRDSDLTI